MMRMNTRNYSVFNLTKIPYRKVAVATVAIVMIVDQILASELSLSPQSQLSVLIIGLEQNKARLLMRQE